jgi:hypothetical protein
MPAGVPSRTAGSFFGPTETFNPVRFDERAIAGSALEVFCGEGLGDSYRPFS